MYISLGLASSRMVVGDHFWPKFFGYIDDDDREEVKEDMMMYPMMDSVERYLDELQRR